MPTSDSREEKSAGPPLAEDPEFAVGAVAVGVEDQPGAKVVSEPSIAVQAPADPTTHMEQPQPTKAISMPLRICPTCKGTRRVQQGGRLYVCPACHGSGGVPLGSAPPSREVVEQPNGASKAAMHVTRGRPFVMPLGPGRR